MRPRQTGKQRAYLVAAIGLVIFGVVAADVFTHGNVTVADALIVRWFDVHSNPAITSLMLVVAAVHSTLGILIAVAIIACGLWVTGRRRDIVVLVVCVPGAMLLNRIAKEIFARHRPHVPDPILVLQSYSFPSGHAAASTALYGFLAWYLVARTALPKRRLAPLVAGVLVMLVCASRVYLRLHYLSDVLGGTALAGAWVALCIAQTSRSSAEAQHARVR